MEPLSEFGPWTRVGNGISFQKKFRRIDSEQFPLFHERKCSFRGIPSSTEEPIPKLGTERKGTEIREKMKFCGTCTASLFYFCSKEPKSELFNLPLKSSEGISESLVLFWFHGTEFRVVFSSLEGFGFQEFASLFVKRNRILSCFLFTEGFGTEFWELSVPRNSRNSVRNNHLFRLFRLPWNYFSVEIPNPTLDLFGAISDSQTNVFSRSLAFVFLRTSPKKLNIFVFETKFIIKTKHSLSDFKILVQKQLICSVSKFFLRLQKVLFCF